MRNQFDMINKLRKRVAVVEGKSVATAANYGLVDDAKFGIDVQVVHKATAPTGLAQSDAGLEWVNTGTNVTSWWDGFSWHTGTFPYENNNDLSMFAVAALAAGRTFFDVTTAVFAPGSPGVGDLWLNAGVYKQYQGSGFVTITDTLAQAVITSELARYAPTTFRVFAQSATPVAINRGDRWFDTDTWVEFIWFITSWNYIPRPGDEIGTIFTGAKFQTAEYGQRMEISSDLAGGVIKFWTGDPTETGPGWINPNIDTGTVLELDIASPHAAGHRSHIYLSDDQITLNPGSAGGEVFISNGDLLTEGSATFAGIGGTVKLPNIPTTTNAANVFITGAGALNQVTSLAKFKLKRQPLSYEAVKGLLDLTPVSWYDKAQVEANGDSTEGLRRIAGYTAEEVEEKAPLFAAYDADGELQSVQYDRIPAALLVLIQNLEKRVAELEGK